MRKIFLIIVALQLVFFFQGCAALKYMDGSSEEEIALFKMDKKKMLKDLQKYKAENEMLEKQVNTLRKKYDQLQDESDAKISETMDQNELLKEQINELTAMNQEDSQDTEIPVEQVTTEMVIDEKPSDETPKMNEQLGKLKIKVLSGDGHLESAKMIAEKLNAIGCNVKRIDHAPRSNFINTTIYSSPEFQIEAKYLSTYLGSNAVHLPLTWSSVFDIIVVTGKKK